MIGSLTKSAIKSQKGMLFSAAVLGTLLVTGSVFAFTATTQTQTLGLTAQGEFASVNATATPPTWNVFGHYKGKMTAGDLFTITPASGFTGDLSATVIFANAYDMVEAYKVVVMKVSIYPDNGSGSPDLSSVIGTEYLTLDRGSVTIDLSNGPTTPYHVYLDSGFYNTFHSWGTNKEDILLLCDVAQKGAM